MRKKNSYSRIIQSLEKWEDTSKGVKIQYYHHCVENNITSFFVHSDFFDLPPKHELGTALSESGLSRDKIQLIGAVRKQNLLSDQIVEAAENILLNLKTDYLDLLLVDPDIPAEDLLPAVEQLQSQGKLIEAGLFEKPGISERKHLPKMAFFREITFSPSAFTSLTLERSAADKVPKMLFLRHDDFRRDERLEEFSQKYNLKPKEFLQAWLLNHPAHYHLMIEGQMEEVDSAVKALDSTLIKEDWEKFPKQ